MESYICGTSLRIGIYFGDFRPEIGGAYTYMADLLGALDEMVSDSQHHYVLLCHPAAIQALRLQLGSPNVTLAPIDPPSRLALSIIGLKYFSSLFRWVWRWHGAVERTAKHHDVQLLWFLGVVATECPDIPYVATLWDLQHRLQPFFPEVGITRIWDKREQFYGYFLRRAAYCVTGTETGKRQIQYLYQLAEPRVRVFPLPTPKFALDASTSKIDARSRFDIGKEFVFYPAQFWSHKNHVNLILALRWLKEVRGLELILALSGSDKGNLAYVKRFAEQQGVAGQVRFLGFVSEEELIALYRQAVALTFVTYFGPDNIPPLEAFALGCPVIASAVDGAQEQYGDAVVYVDPSDPKAIGQAIWSVHSDRKLRKKYVERGFDRARKWTSRDYVRKMFGLFDEFAAIRRNWE